VVRKFLQQERANVVRKLRQDAVDQSRLHFRTEVRNVLVEGCERQTL